MPLSVEPADVHDRVANYSAWLKTASLQKVFIDAEPGVFVTGRIRRLASSFPSQHHVVVKGLHFLQGDSPDEIARAIAGWTNLTLRSRPSGSSEDTMEPGELTDHEIHAAVILILSRTQGARASTAARLSCRTRRNSRPGPFSRSNAPSILARTLRPRQRG